MKSKHTFCALLAAAVLSITCAFTLSAPIPAIADNTEEQSELERLQREVESTAAAYDEAQDALAVVEEKIVSMETKISENQTKIDELEAEIPTKKAHVSSAISTHYKLQQETPNLITLLLSAEDFNQFISTVTYLDIVSGRSTDALEDLQAAEEELRVAREELDTAYAELEEDKKTAENKVTETESALVAAQAARKEAQEAARRRAEEEAAAAEAARKAAEEAAAKEETFETASGNTATVSEPVSQAPVASDDNDWGTDKVSFVDKWAPRIDNYLAGSPLAGYGKTFAEAAWDYGVDPRWSPAISCIESSKGAACFRSHNAWGWGQVDWPDWDTAIRDHVAGLARGYGYTVTPSAAQKYCPPTWQAWYNNVSSEMSRI